MDIAAGKSNKQITKESYEATAEAFARNVADLAPIKSIQTFLDALPSKARILDLGCGSGRDAKIFSKSAEVLGIDYCSRMLELAALHAPLADFKLMDIEEMDFPHASFDGVWAACSLGHIAKKEFEKVLKNIHRLLKNDGCFYLAIKKGSGEKLEIDHRYEGDIKKFWAFYEEDELKSLLKNADFNIVDFALVEKSHPYQTQSAFRVFCHKNK